MKIANTNTSKKVFIIAEIGNNHEGNFDLAKKMIIAAAATGVDAVKFQTFIPEHFVSSEDETRLKRLKKFQLSFEEFNELSKIAKNKGLIFFSTPLDLKSAMFLNTIQPIFKISSGDNNFYPLIEKVASFNKPMIISTGAADLEMIKKVYRKISKVWQIKKMRNKNLAFLHCVSSYPAPYEEVNLASIFYLKKKFPKVVIGYSDHTLGVDAAVLSVIAGARIIEKHFTLDKNFSDFRDHQLSADPNEMRLLVDKVRQAEIMLGKEEKKIRLSEKEMKILGRRSIAIAHNLSAGSKLKLTDIAWVRPGKGFFPGQEKIILGKKICRDLKIGDILKKSDFK